MQWFGTIFGIAATMCFMRCYKKEELSYTRKVMIYKAVSMETGMQNSTLAIAMIALTYAPAKQHAPKMTEKSFNGQLNAKKSTVHKIIEENT